LSTTEISRTAQLAEQFASRSEKPIGLSTDTVAEHVKWNDDVNDTQKTTLRFPIVADADLTIAKRYDMIHPHESKTAAVRSMFIIPPSVTDADARTVFPQSFETIRPYLRTMKL
jgi:peroxiredoxin (alkyl hydroperoxide reductase subunit C)